MKKNQLAFSLALFTTGITGVLVGALVVSQPNFSNTSFAEAEKVLSNNNQITLNTKSDTAEKLSKDFTTIAKNVTPAIVSIFSTKIVKNQKYHDPFFNDPMFRKFFGVPDGQDEGESFENNNESRQQGLGSGVIISDDGYVLTNNHVIEGADDIRVTLNNRKNYKAKIIGRDPRTDVAVIKLENAKNLPTAKLADSSDIQVGEWVLAIGNPFGLSSTVTSGIISAKGRADVGVADFEDFIQTDAAINPGNSGGALVNLNGEVIGINTAIASRTGGYMGIGFAIPSNMAKKVMNDLITKGKVSRGFIGIQIQNLTESLSKSLGLKNSSDGIIVGDIFKDSPAEKAGLKRYDVILELDGSEVRDVNSFRNKIASKNPGETVKLTVWREGKEQKISLKLAELENSTKQAANNTQDNDNNPESANKLGFQVTSITPELGSQLGLGRNASGVIINNIDFSSSAAEAGVNRGDIIQEINRQKVDSISDFNNIVKGIKKGDSVLLKIRRGSNRNILIAFTYQ